MNHNWSARKQRFHPQSVAEIATIQFIWWNTNNTLLKGVISNDLQRHWVNCWFSYSVLKQEVWPLGFSDTVCPRPPLKTQVQHFISRIKKRQRWSVQMMWAYDLDLWPWRSPRLSVVRVLALCQSTKCKFWWYYDYSFSIYGPLGQRSSHWSRDLATLIFDLGGHGTCGWCGSSSSIHIPSLKFVGLAIRKIRHTMFLALTGMITLTFDLLTLNWYASCI